MGNAESVGMAGTDIGDAVHSGLGTSATNWVGEVESGKYGSVHNIADGGLTGALTGSIKNVYNNNSTVRNAANTIANKGGNIASGTVNVLGGPISGALIGAANCEGKPGCTAKAADGQNSDGNATKGLNMSGLEGGLYLESLPHKASPHKALPHKALQEKHTVPSHHNTEVQGHSVTNLTNLKKRR
jgi:hypothetical protein